MMLEWIPKMRMVFLGIVLILFFFGCGGGGGGNNSSTTSTKLDDSFGANGIVMTTFHDGLNNGELSKPAMVLQTDGKIVVVGAILSNIGHDFAIARYNSDGSLDENFGINGGTQTDFGGDDRAYDVALQSDAKIIVAGDNSGSLALARYNPDGSLDTSFGTGGKITISPTTCGRMTGIRETSAGSAIVIQPDGKIIIAGCFGNDFAVTRFNIDGSLDSSFGTEGRVSTNFSSTTSGFGANGIAVQPDGKIIAVGARTNNGDTDFALARYNTNGSLDSTFGEGGKVITDWRTTTGWCCIDIAQAVAIQSDGKIVVGGEASPGLALARYNVDGSLDNSFGSGGRVSIADLESAYGVVLQPDGKIVLAGGTKGEPRFALSRYNPDGRPDMSFGIAGQFIPDRAPLNQSKGLVTLATDVALQSDGKILAVGKKAGHDVALARFNP